LLADLSNNLDANNQPIKDAGGYNNYTNPQYNMNPYQQGYPGNKSSIHQAQCIVYRSLWKSNDGIPTTSTNGFLRNASKSNDD
jgi:hypothetical protein